ncbi:hypothetical protein FQR65_LT14922 [Abscondita terminalis]|nr:hypothetical protein FQR65_LT14922 [Abscondita terminalis]
MVGMTETWMEEKEWEQWKDSMPEEFEWQIKYAKRKEGRAKGGIIVGVRKEWGIMGRRQEKEIEGLIKTERDE